MSKHHKPNIKAYLAVYLGLMFLTCVTVGVSYLNLAPTAAVCLGLAIAIVKATLVAAFFMHLKGEHAYIFLFLGMTLVAFAILVTIPVSDFSATSHKIIRVEGGAAEAAETHH